MTPFDARNEQFLLYPQCLLTVNTSLENFLLFTSNSKLPSADCFNLDQSKILSSGNGLTELIKYRTWEQEVTGWIPSQNHLQLQCLGFENMDFIWLSRLSQLVTETENSEHREFRTLQI